MIRKIGLLLQDGKNFGIAQSAAYGFYKFLSRTGLYRILTPKKNNLNTSKSLDISLFEFPNHLQLKNITDSDQIFSISKQIAAGSYLAFGMSWQPFVYLDSNSDLHWSRAKKNSLIGDIKMIWEPARFDWAIWLAKAYYLTEEEVYFQYFKKQTQEFIQKNPVNSGLNWQSGQEIALRLINLSIAVSLFKEIISLDYVFHNTLTDYLIEHALRIKPTLLYAYAQNNNHLLSEAVGLITASVIFKNDRRLRTLKKSGVFWLNYCLKNQFDQAGAYLQHSTNYHRMVLDLIIWVRFLENQTGEAYVHSQHLPIIEKAGDWLFVNSDPDSGEMANYGHNDGAFLFQFADSDYRDARPTLQALCWAYQLTSFYKPGKYDEKAIWLGLNKPKGNLKKRPEVNFRLENGKSWSVLRVNQFTSRPGQADQNHVDLWYAGKNVVCDAGTYSYNLPQPWHNALAHSRVHNTVTLNGLDQMDQHGTFRWRHWSCGSLKKDQIKRLLIGEQDGYSRFGIFHARRLMNLDQNCWQIEDTIYNNGANPEIQGICLHWLVKNISFQIEPPARLVFPYSDFQMRMELTCNQDDTEFAIFQAGQIVYGNSESDPILGWYAPSYLVKQPALSIVFKTNTNVNRVEFVTTFDFLDG